MLTEDTMAPLDLTCEPMTKDEFQAWYKRLGLKQDDLAARLEVDQGTISRWYNGKREIPPYLRLALERLEQILAEERRPKRGRRGVRSGQVGEGTDAG
jgi:transcriptional regulator with XRE-family HTH domain